MLSTKYSEEKSEKKHLTKKYRYRYEILNNAEKETTKRMNSQSKGS